MGNKEHDLLNNIKLTLSCNNTTTQTLIETQFCLISNFGWGKIYPKKVIQKSFPQRSEVKNNPAWLLGGSTLRRWIESRLRKDYTHYNMFYVILLIFLLDFI